jgi:galactose-1-phosphate uridylyltransferase
VICFSPRHDLILPEMPVAQIRSVVDVWAAQTAELGQTYRWVQGFENRLLSNVTARRRPLWYGRRAASI